jgi:hypothetical protein ELI_1006
MSETLIIEITFGILLSIGSFVLFILAFKLFYKYIIQEKRCTSKVKGITKKYTLATRGGENSGIHLPVVHYIVNGKEYKVVGPEYKAYKIIAKSSPFGKNEMEYKEENQILKINRTSNSFAGVYNNPIEELYPINSEIDVYYDPSNPKLSYVLRYCNKKWLFYLTFCSALLTLVIDLLILFVL